MPGGRLRGRIAVVTGAAGGIGRLLVHALLAEGAKVAALDTSEAGLAALRNGLPGGGRGRLLANLTDVSDYTACEHALGKAITGLGGLHILINNAALGMGAIRIDHQKVPVGIQEISPAMWQRFVATNFSGAWNMTRASIGHLRSQRWGRIINVTTSFATMLRGGFHPYGPCKAALEAMSSGHAKEFEGSGVTVNVVLPGGPADTPMVPPESGFERKDLIPPSVMVAPIVWLCSNATDRVTGNRYIAARWNLSLPPKRAAQGCRAPIGWPDVGPGMQSPGDKPKSVDPLNLP
jgi:NAD(P)-dependent dehydrogenase (short-subunit alcohol dehydrogenase family)